MEKRDTASELDSIADRREAVGYGVSLMTCASCIHVRHKDGLCLLNKFPVNLDRGFCKRFDNIGKYRS